MGLMFLVSNLQIAAAQTNSTIRAEVCDTAGPVVTVTAPQSDSVTDSAQVSLTGSTERTSQIDISINGVYAQSLAIDMSNTFSTTIGLVEGTNTIILDSYYSCNQASAEFTVVVTYVPRVVPSNGGDSSTEVLRPGTVAPGIVSNPRAVEETNQPQSLPERIIENLGLDTKPKPRQESFSFNDYIIPIRSWLALLAGLLLASVAALPPFHLVWIFNAFGWKNSISKRNQIIFRFIAAVLALLFATILQL